MKYEIRHITASGNVTWTEEKPYLSDAKEVALDLLKADPGGRVELYKLRKNKPPIFLQTIAPPPAEPIGE